MFINFLAGPYLIDLGAPHLKIMANEDSPSTSLPIIPSHAVTSPSAVQPVPRIIVVHLIPTNSRNLVGPYFSSNIASIAPYFNITVNLNSWPGNVVVYDPRRYQGTTPRRQRSRHPRASSPHDRGRRRMPSFATPLEDFVSPHSELAHVDLSYFVILKFIGPHMF